MIYRLVLDRIEGPTAVLRLESGDEVLLPVELLGADPHEGGCYTFSLEEVPDEEMRLREEIYALQQEMLSRDKT